MESILKDVYIIITHRVNSLSPYPKAPKKAKKDPMKLLIASDHAGFDLKEHFKAHADQLGIEFIDLGPSNKDSTDYPTHAQNLCKKLLADRSAHDLLEPCGVLICGSGVGMSIAANRFKGIRAVLCTEVQTATLSRQHNASNVLCLGARLIQPELGLEILKSWLQSPFEGGRHQRRIELMD